MKKLLFILFVFVLLTGTVFAKNRDRPNRNGRQGEAASVTVEGVLQLEKGVVALASGDSVYYVPILTHYIGFIDGLKEGTKVSVEGYQFRGNIRPSKVTINGKSYDFAERGNFGRQNYAKGRDTGSRFSQGRGMFGQRRNVYHRGRQGFNRGRFGGCCR